MSSFALALATWLPTRDVLVPAIVGQLPAGVNEAVIIVPTGSWKRPAPKSGARFPSVQVTVISQSYATADTLATQIFDLLNGTGPHVMGLLTVGRVYAAQEPFQLAEDERQRQRFVANYRAVI